MKVLVSDTSALIDLRKASLLEAFLELPFEFVIPDVVLGLELKSFSTSELAYLRGRVTVSSLAEDDYAVVEKLVSQHQALSVVDLFVFRTAQKLPVSVLLTGDSRLRALAEAHKIEVHGVLWIVEKLATELAHPSAILFEALRLWKSDPTCHISAALLSQTERRLHRIYS